MGITVYPTVSMPDNLKKKNSWIYEDLFVPKTYFRADPALWYFTIVGMLKIYHHCSGSENENECVATSIRREVGISFGFTTTSWMDLVMENFFDFPLVTIIHSSRHNTIALMACLWMLIAFYRCTLFCPPTTLIYFGKKIGKNCFKSKVHKIVSNIPHLFLCVFSKIDQGRIKRWTSQLDLGNTTGRLETVVSVHNSTYLWYPINL